MYHHVPPTGTTMRRRGYHDDYHDDEDDHVPLDNNTFPYTRARATAGVRMVSSRDSGCTNMGVWGGA